jgi:hypothetical protein
MLSRCLLFRRQIAAHDPMGSIEAETLRRHKHQDNDDGDRGKKRGGAGDVSHGPILLQIQFVKETFRVMRGSVARR